MSNKAVIHFHHRSTIVGDPKVIQISGEYTRCGEYAYQHRSTKNLSNVTCKRCLKGLAKDARTKP